ncbi:hypothetical protein FRC02_010851 [Tulasnella sp. 418]|nr:hypothetical protein FRC02_010851 [Tulasnella sp. 418]
MSLNASSSESSFIVLDKDVKISSVHPSQDPQYIPGTTASYAHEWTKQSLGGGLKTQGRHFVDHWGRVCMLRGANVSGCSKTPVNHDPSTFPESHRTVTFVGRPFPLAEAPVHFARLRRWGLTFIRFMVTWEALEHAGPGQYDNEYIEYIRSVLTLLPEFGLTAFVSMHQDVWSRYSGGSGAPAWTLELVGFNLSALEETGAAYLGGVKVPGVEADRGRWPTGYQKLAASTMATCFWGGEVFTPKLMVDRNGEKVNVQTYLQDAYMDCFDYLLKNLADLEGIMGFEIMNEPHRGYINLPSLHEFDYNTDLHLNDIPSALQSFALGAGYPTEIPHYIRSFPFPTRLSHHVLRNQDGKKVWRKDGPSGGACVWEMHGVWGWDKLKKRPVVLKESYFTKHPLLGKKVDWYQDCWYPFIKRWADRVHSIAGKDKILFLEPIPNEFCPPSWKLEHQPNNMVFAPHWYDLNALFAKEFGNLSVNVQGLSRGMLLHKALYWGQKSARKNYQLQLGNIVEEGYKSLGERPVLLGECGIPIDMNSKEAFESGDFTWQEKMMDALIAGLERNLIGFTLWNYNPENSDSHGDYWNGENFSWFSQQQLDVMSKLKGSLGQLNSSLDEGGRILPAVVRPYPAKVAGIPLEFQYEMTNGEFVFVWSNPMDITADSKIGPKIHRPPMGNHPPLLARETEIYIPATIAEHRKLLIEFGSGADKYDWTYDLDRQTLFVVQRDTSPGTKHSIKVRFDPPLESSWELEPPSLALSLLRSFPRFWLSLLVLLVALAWYILG